MPADNMAASSVVSRAHMGRHAVEAFKAHWHTTSTIATAFAAQGALIVSGVIVARLLGPENRGHLALLALIPTVLTQIGTLGIPVALTYYIARNKKWAKSLLETWAPHLLLITGCLLLLQVALVALVTRGESRAVQIAGLVTLAATAGLALQMLGLSVLQGTQQFDKFNIQRTMHVAVYAVALLALLPLGSIGLIAVAAVWSSSVLFTGVVTFLTARNAVARAPASPHEAERRKVLAFGLKSLPGQVNAVEMLRVDQIVVGLFAGPVALGYYVVAAAFSNLPRLVGQSIGMVAYPKVTGSGTASLMVALRFLGISLLCCGGIVLALELAAGYAVRLLYGDEFRGAVGLTRVLLISAFFLSLKRVLNDCARGIGHPEFTAAGEAILLLTAIPLLILLVPSHDAIGVAWTLTLAAAAGTGAVTALLLREWRREVAWL